MKNIDIFLITSVAVAITLGVITHVGGGIYDYTSTATAYVSPIEPVNLAVIKTDTGAQMDKQFAYAGDEMLQMTGAVLIQSHDDFEDYNSTFCLEPTKIGLTVSGSGASITSTRDILPSQPFSVKGEIKTPLGTAMNTDPIKTNSTGGYCYNVRGDRDNGSYDRNPLKVGEV